MMARSGCLRLRGKHSQQESEPWSSIPRLKHHLSNKSGQALGWRHPKSERRLIIRDGLRHFPSIEGHIIIDPGMCTGFPVVRGTDRNGIPRGERAVDEVLEAYLSMNSGQALACMAWASRLMATHPFKVSALA
jgi:hypothetical protein